MTDKHARIKQTRQLCKENAKLMHKSTLEEKEKLLDIIKDTVIVHKIEKQKTDLKVMNNMEDENIVDTLDTLKEAEDLEEKQVADEYETIVKKQLQMLQADERGRQALQNEIAEIRRKQEKRAESLRTRAKALEIEKIRTKKIVSRPPPLPRSVKLLLKEQAKKQSELTSELTSQNSSPLQEIIEDEMEDVENKENIDDIYHEIEKKLKQEEWDRKANKRFQEALKKDRLKQEQAEILKEIENAEKLNRRQMARNISESVGKVPCDIPDKLYDAEKQAAMEDAVENIFKRPRSTREHAVEDLDGYEDKWEAKYKEIDSVMESKMAECVPSFVKENYSYLLQEETMHPRGKYSSGLDDSVEDLNRAYIDSPPADILNNSKEIDAVISQLDQMRSELNEAYEKDFKPLLEAESVPKTISIDKAVETDLLKVPTEDKAVEIDGSLLKKPITSSSRSVQVDIMHGGLMSYKRRDLGSMYRSHTNESSSYLPQPKMIPAEWIGDEQKSFSSGLETWSSSSYKSLPSKHGMPNICRFCDSPSCTIPLVEDKKFHKDCIPLAKSLSKPFDDSERRSALMVKDSEKPIETKSMISNKLSTSSIKSKLSSYVQIVADKYLKNKPNFASELVDNQQMYEKSLQVSEHSSPDSGSKSESSIAFSKTKIDEQEHTNISLKRTDDENIKYFLESSDKVSEKLLHSVQTKPDVAENLVIYDKLDGRLESSKLTHDLMQSPDKKTLMGIDSSIEDELLQKCREIISANLSDMFSSSSRNEYVHEEVGHSSEQIADSDQSDASEIQLKNGTLSGYVYHDLSTIPEMDSALINDTIHSVSKETSLNETGGLPKKISLLNGESILENISPDQVNTTSVSLVDAPVSEVSELAKGIQFIKASPEPVLSAIDIPGEYPPVVSGFLDTFHTSLSAATKIESPESVDMLKTPSMQSLSDDQVMNYVTPQDIKSYDNGFKSCQGSELAKGIQFVKASPEPMLSAIDIPGESPPLISGTLVTYTSPSAATKIESPGSVDMLKTPSMQSLSDDQVMNYATPQDIKSYDNGFESCDLQTPSSLSTIQSQLITKSQNVPYSSSFKDLSFKHQHLTHISPLSKYFKDISGIKQDGGTSSSEISSIKSDKRAIKQPAPFQIDSKRQFEMLENSSNSFKPMTPQSYLSTPVGYQKHTISDDENYNLKKKIHLSCYSSSQAHNILNDLNSARSSSGSFKPMTPCSYLTSSSKTDFFSKHAIVSKPAPSSKSDPNEVLHYMSQMGAASLEKTDNSSGSFRPLSSHSDVSTPKTPSLRDNNINFNEKHIQYSYDTVGNIQHEKSGSSSFQPLSMLSDVSTPKIPSPKNVNFNEKNAQYTRDTVIQHENSRTSFFQPLSTLSGVLSPKSPTPKNKDFNEKNTQYTHDTFRNIQHEKSGSSSFQPLSMVSDVSTPKNLSPKNNTDFKEKIIHCMRDIDITQQSKDSNFFQPLSMQYDVSTPKNGSPKNKSIDFYEKNVHDNNKDQLLSYENITASYFQPLTLQSHLSTPSNTLTSNRLNDFPAKKETSANEKQTSKSESVNIQNKGSISNAPRNIIYPLQLNLDIKSTEHFLNPIKSPENCFGDGSYMQEDLLRSDPSVRHKYLQASKTSLKVNTNSVPYTHDEHVRREAKTMKVPSSGFVPCLTPVDFTPFEGDMMDSIKRDISAVAEEKMTAVSMSSTTSAPLFTPSQNLNDSKRTLPVMDSVYEVDGSPSSSLVALPSVKSSNSILDALKQKFASMKSSTPCATPSNGSSSENLSEMFADTKITYQSTPVKSVEEIIQETGILDEPDLTLVNTEYTIKPDSPEKPRLLSESCSLLSDDLKTPTSSQITDLTPSKYFTPTETNSSPFCDSPSMISFLKHEQSCLSNAEEKQWSIKKVSKHGYKKRTKRLWNNLEEVRTKKLIEEKREQLMKNRLKMKAYSKKVATPKKKET